VVIEPRKAPIDKACGEGLMPGAVTALRDLGVNVGGVALAGIRYLDADGHSAEARFRHGKGRGVRRTALHKALTDAVRAAGVEIRQGKVEDVRQSATGVRADDVRGRYLVAADGLHSPIRAQLGLRAAPRTARRWGLRAHFRRAPWTDLVEVHWGEHSEAYVTPVGRDLIGVAVLSGRQHAFATAMEAFSRLRPYLAGCEPVGVRGAGPLRQRVRTPVAGRVLLVGDAAGYVDALTGEGLAIAFASARAAVDAVLADDPGAYERQWRRLSRRARFITEVTLWSAGQPVLRPHLVPAARRAPWLYGYVVNQLAG
jgi:flavin-dependent dehydrogenase